MPIRFFKNVSDSWVPNGSPPLAKITTYLRHRIARISKPSFKMEKTMEADCKKQAKTVCTYK